MKDPIDSQTRTSEPDNQENLVIEYEKKIIGLQKDLAQLQSELNKVNANQQTHGSHDIEPSQGMILIARLRQQRDESRCAVQFLNIERASLIQTNENLIVKLRDDMRQQQEKNELQRNELVLTVALLRQGMMNTKPDHHNYALRTRSFPLEAQTANTAQKLEVQGSTLDGSTVDSTRKSSSNIETKSLPSTAHHEEVPMQIESPGPFALTKTKSDHSLSPDVTGTDMTDTALNNQSVLPEDLLNWGDSQTLTYGRLDSSISRNEASILAALGNSVDEQLSPRQLHLRISSLNGTIAELQEQMRVQHETIDLRDRELQSMETRLSVALADVSSYQAKLSSLKDEVASLTADADQPTTREVEIGSHVASLTNGSQGEEAGSTNSVADMPERISIANDELATTRETLRETLKIVSELKAKQLANESAMEEIETHCSDLCIELQQKSDELVRAEIRLKTMEVTINEASSRHDATCNDLSQKLAIASAKLADLEQEKETHSASLRQEIQELKAGMEGSKAEEQKLNHQLDSHEDANQKLEMIRTELLEQLAFTSTQLADAKREKEEMCAILEAKISELNVTVITLTTMNEDISQQLASYKDRKDEIARDESLSKQLDAANAKLVELEQEKEESCASYEEKIRGFEQMIEDLSSKNAKLAHLSDLLDQTKLEKEEIQAQLSKELALASVKLADSRTEREESCSILQEEIQSLKTRIEQLESELTSTRDSSQTLKQVSLDNLAQARSELEILRRSSDAQSARYAEAEAELERLRSEIAELKVQQGLSDELAKEFDSLVVEFDLHQNKLQQSLDEVEALRAQAEEYSQTKQAMTTDLAEKDALINSLKADLATVSKLHRNFSLVELNEKMSDLEARLATKTEEAEDALDRLIDEMQKNKRLLNLIENLKVKLKTKERNLPATVQESPKPLIASSSNPSSEPIVPVDSITSSASRKRKLNYATPTSIQHKPSSSIKSANLVKENSGSGSDGSSLPRKTILHPKLIPRENGEETQTESQPLQARSVNQLNNEDGSRRHIRDRTLSGAKPGPQTSASLLASIQSLRKKQQQQATNLNEDNHQSSIKRQAY